MNNMLLEKSQMRRALKAVLRQFSPQMIGAKSAALTANLLKTSLWREAAIVCAFCAMPDEVETDGLIAAALAQGKIAGLPRMDGDDLIFHRVSDVNAPFVTNRFGIREPAADWPILRPAECEGRLLIITPGLAFDRQCYRLGRGKGFYDRLLGRLKQAHGGRVQAVGVGFAEQLVARVPVAEHDAPVDCVVTDIDIITRREP